MIWDLDPLWAKAKYYFAKALTEPRDSQDFGLFCSFALEFLGRAALAKIHPVLLADPQDGSNILAVFGYVKPDKTPKSIVAKTIFDRCKTIVPDFLPADEQFAVGFVERRNGELHSGEVPFADYSTAKWLADYYLVVDKLCMHCGKTLDELIGDGNEVLIAREMISASGDSVKKTVFALISATKTIFEQLDAVEQAAKIAVQNALQTSLKAKVVDCPACGAHAAVSGKHVKSTPPKLVDDEIHTEEIYLPDELACGSCGLHLTSHAQLHVLGMGGQYSVEFGEDASEFYQRTYAQDDHDDYEDYAND